MKYGVYAPNFGAYGDPHNLLALANAAETAGWDGLFLWDHLLLYRRSQIPVVDTWVALSAIAARTNRLIIGPLITPLARRRPWKVAREIVSLDQLSRGRAVLGIGLGAPADSEFECFGEDPTDRIRAQKMDEALEVIDALQKGQPVSHDGEYFHIDDVQFLPEPIQKPRVPIWAAAFYLNVKPLSRAGRWDGVFPLKPPSSAVEQASPTGIDFSTMWLSPEELKECADIALRDRTSENKFDVVASGATPTDDPKTARRAAQSFEDVGATWWLEWLDEQRGTFDEMLYHIRQGPPR